MSYEDQLIREATGQNRDFVEPEPEETNDNLETGDEQGETRQRRNKWIEEIAIALHTETKQGKSSGRRKYRYGGK